MYNISESPSQQQVEDATWAITGRRVIKLYFNGGVLLSLAIVLSNLTCKRIAASLYFFPSFSPNSPSCRDGELQVSENVHLSLQRDDMGYDQAAESGEPVGKCRQTCLVDITQPMWL